METIHVQFDELSEAMAPVQLNTGPAPTISDACTNKFRARTKSGSYSILCTPTNKDLEILFQPMFDEYLEPPRVDRPVSPALPVLFPVNSAVESTLMDENSFALVDKDPFINIFSSEHASEAPSSRDANSANSTYSLVALDLGFIRFSTFSVSAGAPISAGDPNPAVTSISAGFSVSAASSIPAATPIAAGIPIHAGDFVPAGHISFLLACSILFLLVSVGFLHP
nr:hypothetical protein [Tanacetum cinerariifolium]